MMFSGLFKFNGWYTAFAGLSIILAAVYTLSMVQKVFYGETNGLSISMSDISMGQKLILSLVVLMIFATGIYPQPFFEISKDSVAAIITRFK